MRRSSSIVLVAAAALSFAIAGCGGDATGPDTNPVGLYDMVSVDGDPLPVTLIDTPGYTLQVTQGSLDLMANYRFVESITTAETVDGVLGPIESTSCLGSYSRSGSTITLTTPETDVCAGQRVTGTLSGTSLTVDYDGTVVVFQR